MPDTSNLDALPFFWHTQDSDLEEDMNTEPAFTTDTGNLDASPFVWQTQDPDFEEDMNTGRVIMTDSGNLGVKTDKSNVDVPPVVWLTQHPDIGEDENPEPVVTPDKSNVDVSPIILQAQHPDIGDDMYLEPVVTTDESNIEATPVILQTQHPEIEDDTKPESTPDEVSTPLAGCGGGSSTFCSIDTLDLSSNQKVKCRKLWKDRTKHQSDMDATDSTGEERRVAIEEIKSYYELSDTLPDSCDNLFVKPVVYMTSSPMFYINEWLIVARHSIDKHRKETTGEKKKAVQASMEPFVSKGIKRKPAKIPTKLQRMMKLHSQPKKKGDQHNLYVMFSMQQAMQKPPYDTANPTYNDV